MPSKSLLNARDLVTKTVYGEVEGKKVVVATIYSSASLDVEERVNREEPIARATRNRGASTPVEEKKE